MQEFILIVDDDKDIRRLVGIYLGNEGYRCLACENAAQAMDILEHYQVDLILMDVMMPEIDGISACLRIREKSKMPIIFMSAKTEDIDIIQGLTVRGDAITLRSLLSPLSFSPASKPSSAAINSTMRRKSRHTRSRRRILRWTWKAVRYG